MLAAIIILIVITIIGVTKRAHMAIKVSPLLISNHRMGQDSISFVNYMLQTFPIKKRFFPKKKLFNDSSLNLVVLLF